MPAKAGAIGTPGYANNTPGVGTPTILDGDVLNTWMAEITNVVLASGQTLDPTNNAQLLAAIRLLPHGEQAFTASGSFTVPAEVYFIHAQVWGAGGGGGGASASGGAAIGGAGGGYTEGTIAVTPGAVIPMTIGAGGGGAGLSGTGGNGGTSSVGSYMTCTGGQGGLGATSSVQTIGSTPGTGSGGLLNIAGGIGISGFQIAGVGFGGAGGTTVGSPAPPISSGAGSSPVFAGAGGGGGANGNGGALGNNGLIIIKW